MKLVIYLSGRCKSASFHRTQDSVAASATISQAWFDENGLDEYFEDTEEGLLPYTSSDLLHDLCSDLSDEGDEMAARVLSMLDCEASCGIVHLVRGRA